MIDSMQRGAPARPGALPFSSWEWLTGASQVWWARSQGAAAVDRIRRARLQELLRHARRHSRLHAAAWRDLPAGELALGQLPVMHKRELMAAFDDWVTDPQVTRRAVDAFLADPARIGEPFAGRHAVWRSSGSTGEPGIFVHDPDALAVYSAMLAHHILCTPLAASYSSGLLTQAGRAALVTATGGHFASIAAWHRQNRDAPWCRARAWSAMQPLRQLVDALNDWQPAFLASYPTVLALLAEQQQAGALRISPTLLWAGGEYLATTCRRHIEAGFACPLVNEYGSSECLSIAYECPQGWMHLNADWVILEPVDADGQPTPAGAPSHSCLLTNLANRVQPIIRYDLGDSILALDGRCPCGSAMPAFRIRGRMDDVLSLSGPAGRIVRLPPLALTTVVEEGTGLSRFQIVQTAPDALVLRIEAMPADDRARCWGRAQAALRAYLDVQGLGAVRLGLGDGPPVPDPVSGKLREVLAASRQRHSC